MRKFVLSLVIFLSLLYTNLCYAGDFREAYFGMTLEEVKALEPDFKYDPAAQLLYGHTELMGLKAEAVYSFNEAGVFVSATHNIEGKHKDPQIWVNRFMDLESYLTTKYGIPFKNQIMSWVNPLHKGSKEEWGLAIQKRHLSILSRWETRGKRIVLHIEGHHQKRKKMHLTIHYSKLQKVSW